MAKKGDPFSVIDCKVNGTHVNYDILLNNRPFLHNPVGEEGAVRLKRHQAYAIARLLNAEKSFRKWAEKFADPYE